MAPCRSGVRGPQPVARPGAGVIAAIVGAAVALGAAAAVGVLAARRLLVVVTVAGPSMQPTFHTGDRVLVRRTHPARIPTGQVVVLQSQSHEGGWDTAPLPRVDMSGQSWWIKRLAARAAEPVPEVMRTRVPDERVPAGHVAVLGDNNAASSDSRAFGFVPESRVLGVVLRRMGR